MKKSITRKFSFVAEDSRRGAGDYKDKNVPVGTGNVSFSTSLAFLYNQKEKAREAKKNGYTLGIIHSESGYDSVKKRLNYSGIFGKQVQNNYKKLKDLAVTQYLLVAGVVPFEENNKLDQLLVRIIKELGDNTVTVRNHKKSAFFEQALEKAKKTPVIVTARYDDGFYQLSEQSDETAMIGLSYVSFSTGRYPLFSSFDKSELTTVTIENKEYKTYPFNSDGTVTLMTNYGWLKNFNGSKSNNLALKQNRNDPNQKFWSVNLGFWKTAELPKQFIACFPEYTRAALMESESLSINYVLKASDYKTKDELLNGSDDKLVVFSGVVDLDLDGSRVGVYKNAEGKQVLTLYARSGAFYTERVKKHE